VQKNTKLQGCLFFVLLFSLTFYLSASAADSAGKEEPKWDLMLDLHASPGYTFQHFPLSIRSVPLHKDDEWLSGSIIQNSPLPDTGQPLHLHESVALALILTYSPKPVYSIGVVLSLRHYNPHACINSDQRFQMNQWGDADRIQGASLRWYQVKAGSFQLGVTGRIKTRWAKLGRLVRLRTMIGGIADVTGLRLQTEAGWDRWGSDEHWKTSTIGRLYEHQIFWRIEGGVTPFPSLKDCGVVYLYLQVMQPFYMFHKNSKYSETICQRLTTPRFSAGIGMNVYRLWNK